VTATPLPSRPSARRTTSTDVTRPDGPLGEAVVRLGGRDLAVDAAGATTVTDALALALRLAPDGTILAVGPDAEAGPSTAGERAAERLAPLVGTAVRSGAGRRLATVLADDLARRTLLGSLVEDLPGAVLVSGYALLRADVFPADPARGPEAARRQADVCAGWAAGGPVHVVLATEGRNAVPSGPEAPVLEKADPDGWHPLPDLPPGAVRRRRLLDVTPWSPPGAWALRAHFRDSYAGEPETVMHEYAVDAEVGADGRLARVHAAPLVLPWQACPAAVASASRLVGVAAADLPGRVRADLAGTSTCTHLNSTLRTLADVGALAPTVPVRAAGAGASGQ
jgi:hypothetical protein